MKYSEAKKEIEALSSKYSAYKDKYTNFFNVYYKNEEVAYVRTNERYSVTVWFEKHFPKLPFSNKLYMILAELSMAPLDERVEEKKHCVKVFGGELGYLNIDISNGNVTAGSVDETNVFKTKFTDKAIEQLKQRDDISLDWSKVKFEKADDQMKYEQEKLYVVKNDEGKYWDIGMPPWWDDKTGSVFKRIDLALRWAKKYDGHVITLTEEPEKVVLTKEQAEIVENARDEDCPATYISDSTNLAFSGEEDMLMKAYVNGYTV